MELIDYIEIGLNGEAPLKVIMRGSIEVASGNNIGVVSLVYATTDKKKAKEKINTIRYGFNRSRALSFYCNN